MRSGAFSDSEGSEGVSEGTGIGDLVYDLEFRVWGLGFRV